jgi:hypothetical protein
MGKLKKRYNGMTQIRESTRIRFDTNRQCCLNIKKVETRDHHKNGAKPKSQTSRKILKKTIIMSAIHLNVKLSKRFYIFSIVSGLLFGALSSTLLIRPIAKNFTEDIDESLYKYRDGSPDTYSHSKAVFAARDSAEAKVGPFIILAGGVLFIFIFIIVGRHRQPISLNNNGVYVWNWFGKKLHLWTDYTDKSIINVKSTGIKLSRFEQFHFSTGTVSVNTKRLENGEEVLMEMDKMTNKA